MLIDLDVCCLQRPLDDKSQPRVRLEAEAILGIIAFCESGEAVLVSSDALEFETGWTSHPVRKAHALGILSKATHVVRLSPGIEQRARMLTQTGIKPLDALHLSCAVDASVDYFCTCDDRLLKRARAALAGVTKFVGPLELVGELGL